MDFLSPVFQIIASWSGVLLILWSSVARYERVIDGRLVLAKDGQRQDAITVILFVIFIAVGVYGQVLIVGHTPHTIDTLLLRADTALGFNTFSLIRYFSGHQAFRNLFAFAYMSLAFVIGLVWILEQDRVMRRAVFIGGVVCFAFYFLFPATGPVHFDWVTLTPDAGAPRDCMPSMHFTWALLLAINARGRTLSRALWAYAAVIAFSTLALGQHYFVDLVVAVPYTIAIELMADPFFATRKSYSTYLGVLEVK